MEQNVELLKTRVVALIILTSTRSNDTYWSVASANNGLLSDRQIGTLILQLDDSRYLYHDHRWVCRLTCLRFEVDRSPCFGSI